MLDNQGRILIPKEFLVKTQAKAEKAYFYFSTERERFYILFKKAPGGYFMGERNIDSDGRVEVPEVLREAFGTKDVFCASKDERLYLISLKKD